MFFNKHPNLEDNIEFFKFLKKLNKQRAEKKRKKIPIIFIGNNNIGKEGVDGLRKFLLDNDLGDLLENFENKKKKKDFSIYGQKFQKKEEINSIIDNNIIKVNLIADKKTNKIIYGIDKLLKTTLYILKKDNPFTKFNELEEMNEIIQKYLAKLNKGVPLSKTEEKDFIEYKKKIANIMLRLSEENYLLNQIKNTDDIIIKSRKKAYKMLIGFMAGGFLIGLIPVPFLDIPLSFGLYAGMIVKIGHCYFFSFQEIPIMDFIKLLFGIDSRISKSLDNDEPMKPLEICHKTLDTVRVVGNVAAYQIGNKLGQQLAMNIGAKKAANWAMRGLRFVPKGMGKQIFKKEIKEVVVKKSFHFDKIMEIIMQLIPSMKKGAEKGVEKAAKSLGEGVGNTYFQNTIHFAGEQLQKMCESRAKDYAAKITKESAKYLKTLSKVMPIIGSIVGGVLDCWGTYSVGNNAIKYFEDYITKTLGCDYVINQKNSYFQIFEDLDFASNENYEQFDYNLYELDNCDYLNYA